MAAFKQIRLPDGQEIIIDEWLHEPLYSTIEFAAGVIINLRAFTYIQGQRVPSQGLAARTATESDTNITTRTRFNHDQAFLAYSLTWESFALSDSPAIGPITTTAPAPALSGLNLRVLQREVVAELLLGAGIDKPQARAPFSWYGQGVGAPAWTAGDSGGVATLAVDYGTGGRISPKTQRSWKLPIFIHSDRVMTARIRSFRPAGDAAFDQDARLRLYIDGLKRRPVG